MQRRSALLCLGAFCLALSGARADGLGSLQQFLTSTTSARAEFTQVVTAPPRDGQPARVKTSSGTFAFARPGRFRFDYRKPFEQIIVADGKTLWLYDVDLNQVTARDQAQALGSTPAALIAAAADRELIGKEFDLQAAPEKDGLQWVVATPKVKEGQLQSVKVGFRVSGGTTTLAALEIRDGFGQYSVLTFSKQEVDPVLAPGTFEFQVPAGADVLRQ